MGTHYKLLFPKDYLAAPHLKGRDVTLTVEGVSVEALHTSGGTEMKPVMTFVELERRFKRDPTKVTRKLVLNVTNAETIAGMHGPEIEGWTGKAITIYPTTTRFGRDTVDCIRVRKRKPASKAHPEADDGLPDGDGEDQEHDPSTGEVPVDQEPSDEQLGLG